MVSLKMLETMARTFGMLTVEPEVVGELTPLGTGLKLKPWLLNNALGLALNPEIMALTSGLKPSKLKMAEVVRLAPLIKLVTKVLRFDPGLLKRASLMKFPGWGLKVWLLKFGKFGKFPG
jgi:hypothetical protein